MLKSILLVVNPVSRYGLRRREAALAAFQDAGVAVREVMTAHPGHAREVLMARADPWDAVFVLGGDGTVMEVATALVHSSTPIGVLPGGTGNLVAGVLGVPRSMRRAVSALLSGMAVPLDLGQLPDGRCFAFAAGVGVDVAMVRGTSIRGKRALGMLSYVLAAARAALGRDLVHVTVDVDGRRIEARATLAMVANAGSLLGNRFFVGPEIRPDDGELNLCLFTPESTGDVVSIIWRLLHRDFSPHPRMTFVRGRRFRITADPPVAVQADGDLVGTTPIEITVRPRAAVFLRPRVTIAQV